MRAVGLLGVVTVSLGVAVALASSSEDLQELPLSGATADGQRWRLQIYRPHEKDDVATSWCLRLRYSGDVVIDGDPFVGGGASCGKRPARRVDGVVSIDCPRKSVFVYGGARKMVRSIRLDANGESFATAVHAKLPPHSGFDGFTFIAVSGLPAGRWSVVANGAGQRVLLRVPRRSKMCAPMPGAPQGGQPFADFRSRR